MAMIIAVSVTFIALAATARAQSSNLPPPGAYQPIPNYTGTNAGLLFRQAINNRFSGAQPISPAIVSLSFATLPAEQDGTLFYCTDCQKTAPCASGGSGAWAFGQNRAWSCAAAGGSGSLPMSGDVSGTTGANTVQTVLSGKTPVVTSGTNTAAGSTGADSLNNFNVNGQVNVADYGKLSTSVSTETATTTSGSTSIALGAIGPFQVGGGVMLPHAGPTASVTAPAGLTGSTYGYALNPHPTAELISGNCNVDSSNASCTTSYSVTVMAVDANGGWSPAPTAVTVANGPATLSVANGIDWKWTCEANAPGYIVLGCTGASCTPTSIWAVVPARFEAGACDFWDFGNHFGSDITYGSAISTTVEGTGAHQDLSTKITAVSGSTLTLATAPGVSGTFTAIPDNAPIGNAAIGAVAAGGGDVLWPSGGAVYNVSQLSFFNAYNVHLGGNRVGWWGSSTTATALNYIGSAGRPMFYMNWAPGDEIHDMGIGTGSTPGIIAYIDADPWVTGGLQRSKANAVRRIKVGLGPNAYGGAFATIGANSTGGENEFVAIDHNYTSPMFGYIGVEVAAGYQTDNTEIDDNEIGTFNIGIQEENAGTITEKNNDTSDKYIYHRTNGYIKQWNMLGDFSDGEPAYWLYDGIGGGAIQQLRIEGSQIVSTPGPNGYGVYALGANTFINNLISCTNVALPCLIGTPSETPGFPAYRRSIFINNTYGEIYPSSLPASFEPPNGLPITDGNGVQAVPSFVSLGETIFNATTDTNYATGDIFNGEVGLSLNATPLNLTPTTQTITGTSGTAIASMSMQGTLKIATVYLNGYAQTGTAQTYTFPVAFSAAPNLLASCGTYNPSSTATVLTLPANASMTAETCNVAAIGQ
ncbi:MAG TPA: hypothetical protein VNF29_08660 [Candidatus Binataceae bacterium]|nr:hypothetical protein [Candidatus Binataceae bacterium]